jgi:hypothetical protein
MCVRIKGELPLCAGELPLCAGECLACISVIPLPATVCVSEWV